MDVKADEEAAALEVEALLAWFEIHNPSACLCYSTILLCSSVCPGRR
jgi:hypothetical protein